MPQAATRFTDAGAAIHAASALTETTFLRVGQDLETSTGILAALTARFAAVLEELEGAKPGLARQALLAMAAEIRDLGRDQSQEAARFQHMHDLAETIGNQITHMKSSLKDIECLAVNAKIAAAQITGQGTDFVTFAAEIGSTLTLTRSAFDRFATELHNVRHHVAIAQDGCRAFAETQRVAAASITERLSATVKSVALQQDCAARASLEVRHGSARVRQRICDAILALQIGDITRQRLEHADFVLGLIAGSRRAEDAPALDVQQKRLFVAAAHRLQSAQLDDAARNFDRDVRQVIASLDSLAAEAKALRALGQAAYGAADHDGSFVAELEGQIAEALALLEDFETARAEVASATAAVSVAAAGLCDHLRTVQSLEDDVRIMGLNTTFRCARIGSEGVALGIIAQELRAYADGFAKAASTLMHEVETVASINNTLTSPTAATEARSVGAQAAHAALATLRQTGQLVDRAMAELEQDSNRVVRLLSESASNLARHTEIGLGLRAAAEHLAELAPAQDVSFTDLPMSVVQMLAVIERGYTMASERTVHDRLLGRAARAAPVAPSEAALEEFLF